MVSAGEMQHCVTQSSAYPRRWLPIGWDMLPPASPLGYMLNRFLGWIESGSPELKKPCTESERGSMNKAKQKYFDRVYAESESVECACGCGTIIKNKDRFGRDKKFVSGHNGRIYSDKTQYKREWNHRNRKSRYEYKAKHLVAKKLELILSKGNKCEDCGYECDGTNGRAFDFHHRNPVEKELSLNANTLNKVSMRTIKKELLKCVLLCARCHRLRH